MSENRGKINYKKCPKYSEDERFPVLYGNCSIFGYCMIAAELIKECNHFPENDKND